MYFMIYLEIGYLEILFCTHMLDYCAIVLLDIRMGVFFLSVEM